MISTDASSLRIAVDPIECLHVFGFPETRPALWVVVVGVRRGAVAERAAGRERGGRARTQPAQERAPAERRCISLVHFFLSAGFARFGVAPRGPRHRTGDLRSR